MGKGREAAAGDGDPVRAPENLALDLAFLTQLQLPSSLTWVRRPEPRFPHLYNGDNLIKFAGFRVYVRPHTYAHHRQQQ